MESRLVSPSDSIPFPSSVNSTRSQLTLAMAALLWTKTLGGLSSDSVFPLSSHSGDLA